MRHRVYGKHLGRDKDERDRLFKSLISQLILHGSIETSDKKAKAIKGLVDKIINLAKDKKTYRLLQQFIVDKDLRERLIKDIVPKLGDRTSGYTLLVKLGKRLGDRSMVVRMSLIGAEKMEPMEKRVPQVERVPQVSRVRKTDKKIKPRGTRGTSTKKTISRKTKK